MHKKYLQIPTIFLILIALVNISFAQETGYSDKEIQNYPWESYSDYSYFEDASHFWNLNFRPGIGNFSINAFEYLEFKSQSSFLHYTTIIKDPNEPDVITRSFILLDGKVQDYWTGVSFGGVVYKYFHVKIEGGWAHKTENRQGVDEYDETVTKNLKYKWDITFNAELRAGIPINKDFTLVGMTSFRVWSTEILDYETYDIEIENEISTTIDKKINIPIELYLFRAQVQLYFEVFENEKNTSLNVFAGLGFHTYQVQELDFDINYSPDKKHNMDAIVGATLLLDNQYMIELKIIPVGVFTAQLQFSYVI